MNLSKNQASSGRKRSCQHLSEHDHGGFPGAEWVGLTQSNSRVTSIALEPKKGARIDMFSHNASNDTRHVIISGQAGKDEVFYPTTPKVDLDVEMAFRRGGNFRNSSHALPLHRHEMVTPHGAYSSMSTWQYPLQAAEAVTLKP
jgi:hypothetical protein